jgi:hypothetical protein
MFCDTIQDKQMGKYKRKTESKLVFREKKWKMQRGE